MRSAPRPAIEYPLIVLLSMSTKTRNMSSADRYGSVTGPMYIWTVLPAYGAGNVAGIVVFRTSSVPPTWP